MVVKGDQLRDQAEEVEGGHSADRQSKSLDGSAIRERGEFAR